MDRRLETLLRGERLPSRSRSRSTTRRGTRDADSGSVYVDSDGPELEILTDIPSNTQRSRTRSSAARTTGAASPLARVLVDRPRPDRGRERPARFDVARCRHPVTGESTLPTRRTATPGYIEGGYVLKVFSRDSFDNKSDGKLSFKLDRTAPAPPRIADPPGRMIQSRLDLYIQLRR